MKSARTIGDRCAPDSDTGWYRASASRTKGKYAAPKFTSMSQYHKWRTGSQDTSCGATSTRTVVSFSATDGCGRLVHWYMPGGWSASSFGANAGSHSPVGSGCRRASGKFVVAGVQP